jgi:hypothetical protein
MGPICAGHKLEDDGLHVCQLLRCWSSEGQLENGSGCDALLDHMHPIQHAHGPLPPLEGTHTHDVGCSVESHTLGWAEVSAVSGSPSSR